MLPFLHRVAEVLLHHHASELDRIAVVLPSRRAGSHLRSYLAKVAGRTIWSPEMLDMGGFNERLTGMRQGGSLEMLFMLHDAHRSVEGDRAEPISEFMQWAPVTLRDMSEVDAHLLDLDDLYRDLRDFHEIEEWSFRLGELSPGQDRMMQQWRSTGTLHRELALRMSANAMGTSGYVARQATIGARQRPLPWKAVWYVGLNALDPASLSVAAHLQHEGNARFAWDADVHYLSDRDQEAGTFLRRTMAILGPGELPPVDMIRTRSRTLTTTTVPSRIAQASFAAQHIMALSSEERANTAVVLADEDLLMPLIEALPSDAGPLNITMGMPLASLPVNGLAEAFFDLHAIAQPNAHHLPALERLLAHPFLHQGTSTSRSIAALRALQRPWVDMDTLLRIIETERPHDKGHSVDMLQPLAHPVASELAPRLNALLSYAQQLRPNDRFIQEQLYRIAKFQQRLHLQLERAGAADIDQQSYSSLRTRMLSEERITFFGEPLQGLQVMGFLEARAIDHEQVLLLGANEGTLPPTSGQQSWIPFDIRRAYKLPLNADTGSITAYHFQRLTQHVRKLHMVYATGDTAASGPTRYIAQWKHEVIGHSATQLIEASAASAFPLRTEPTIAAKKDGPVIARLGAICAQGISPSALATWLTCPLDFYFKYILRLRPTEDVDEKLGSDVLGEAVHNVLEDLLRPLMGTALNPAALGQAAGSVSDALHAKLGKQFSAQTLGQGYFRLRIGMASQALMNYLNEEADRIKIEPTTVIHLEHDVTAVLGDGIVLKGRCDRIEERGGTHHILDLKTGGVQARDLQLSELTREAIGPDQRYALQLLIYAWCYLKQHPEVGMVRAGVVPLQRPSQSAGLFLKIDGSADITRTMLPELEQVLGALIAELRDAELPFTHRPESKYCTCCIPTA